MTTRPWPNGAAHSYCDTIASQTVSVATQDDYRYSLEHWVLPHIGSLRLNELTPDHCADMQQQLLNAGLAPNTVRHARRPLSVALNHAVRTGRLRMNPVTAVPQPRVTNQQVTRSRWLNREQALALIVAAETAAPVLQGFIAFGLHRGLRRGEILGLRWEDIDEPEGVVHLRGRLREERVTGKDGQSLTQLRWGPPKTKTSVRDLALSPAIARALTRVSADQAKNRLAAGPAWSNDRGYVFTTAIGDPFWPSNMYHRYKKFLNENGLPNISVHDLRRTFANLAMQGDARLEQVSEALGHASIEVTKSVYIGSVPALARRAFEQFDSFIEDTPEPVRLHRPAQ